MFYKTKEKHREQNQHHHYRKSIACLQHRIGWLGTTNGTQLPQVTLSQRRDRSLEHRSKLLRSRIHRQWIRHPSMVRHSRPLGHEANRLADHGPSAHVRLPYFHLRPLFYRSGRRCNLCRVSTQPASNCHPHFPTQCIDTISTGLEHAGGTF